MACRVCSWLAWGVIAFTFYVSLLPFRLQPVGLDHAWASSFEAITAWPRRVPRTNFVANVLLFVPIGFGLSGVNNLLAGFGLAVPIGIGARWRVGVDGGRGGWSQRRGWPGRERCSV